MARKRFSIPRRNLGIAMVIALCIDLILPALGLKGLGIIATVIYIFVGLYLLLA